MDLIYVTYNSQRWIEGCFASLARSDAPLDDVHIWVVDNASKDNTLQLLSDAQASLTGKVGGFEIVSNTENLGFGRANNLGASKGSSPILCFLNIDTELAPDTLRELRLAIDAADPDVAMWEMRQLPYEHPKLYDPITLETSWCSGAAVAVRRSAYEQVGGFDEGIFLYAEDVDLSWRLRSFGHRLQYVPRAAIHHYSYQSAGEIKPAQYTCGQVNSLMLRYRFGSFQNVLEGHARIWWNLLRHEAFPGSRKLLLREYRKGMRQVRHFKEKGWVGDSPRFTPKFLGYEYEVARLGAFHEHERPEARPLVSVVVRTCGRPAVLRETLLSLRNQTYDALEIVVVEDGPDVSRQMIETEFSDLGIVYEATGERVGRSKAGNRAMTLAHGAYINFLDDDDLFFADHVETLVALINGSKKRAAYAFAFETPIRVTGQDPYEYNISGYLSRYKQPFDRTELCYHNYIPIQCILFEKSLFEEYGGLDESLDYLEDWDLWVRYAQYTDFSCAEKTTSLYRVPSDPQVNTQRQKKLDDALAAVREKHKGYHEPMTAYELAMLYRRGMSTVDKVARIPWVKRIVKKLLHM